MKIAVRTVKLNSMKKLSLLPVLVILFSLQGCSWRIGFYIANSGNEPLTVDVKLMDAPGTFPIFHYPGRYFSPRKYALQKDNSVDFNTASDIKTDTLEKYSHYKLQLPPHTAVEIGELQNDHYEKHDQYFINGRVFNLEKITISEKKIEIVPAVFDNYFKNEKNNGVYFVL